MKRTIENLPTEVRKVIEEIAEDKTSGSSILARRGLEAYKKLTYHSFKTSEELEEAVKQINSIISLLRPSMPLIARFSNEVFERFQKLNRLGGYAVDDLKSSLVDICSSVQGDYDRIVDNLVRNCLMEVGGLFTVLTISFSGTVLKFLERAEGVRRVVVLESRPMREGVEMAKLLCREKSVTLYVDAAMSYAVEEAEAVVIGADALYRGVGFVGKIGSLPLCIISSEVGKPTYILVDSWKIAEKPTHKEMKMEEGDVTEVINGEYLGNIRVRNPYFELVPSKYVSCYVTDFGAVKDI